MCDSQGNLLFYASSRDVYNKQHQIMANGGGIGFGTALAAFAMKQPGNQNIYYLFEYNYYNAPVGFMYSIIDMSLAAGMGSVTAKDVPICSGISCTRNFGASPHANGVDMWIVTHSATSNIFSAYLLTAAGLNTVAVTSACGYSYVINSPWKYINFSPNGRKCATSFLGAPGSGFTNTELYDFNRSTGVVSNALDLNHPGQGERLLSGWDKILYGR